MEEILSVYSIKAVKIAFTIIVFLYLTTALLDVVLYILEGPSCKKTWKKHSSTFTLSVLLLRLFIAVNGLLIFITLIVFLFN